MLECKHERSIEVTLNGKKAAIAAPATASLLVLLDTLGYDRQFVAVALNRQCIRRQDYATTELNAGDAIEILAPMAGG